MNGDKPRFVSHGADAVSDFSMCSIWKNVDTDVSFSFINFDYPTLHTHKDFCEILFVYTGSVVNWVNGKSSVLNAGDCCIVLKNDRHKFVFPEYKNTFFSGINFLIKENYYERLKYLFGDQEAKFLEKTDEIKSFGIDDDQRNSIYNQTLLLQTPNNMYVKKNEFLCKTIIVELIKSYVSKRLSFSSENRVPDWLREMLAKMQDLSNIDKNPGAFVKDVPYSYSYIAKEFKRYMGCPIVKYFMSVKLNYAKELLLNTDLTTLMIASKIGFDSLSHFNHIFKTYYGKTPSQIRNGT